MIIAIEGIDASGKGTQTRRLLQWALNNMADLGLDEVHAQHFPDYTNVTGVKIGELLRGEWSVVHNMLGHKEYTKALVMQSLMVTNRLEHGRMLAKFANSSSKMLVLDRYHVSGKVYGKSDGLPSAFLDDIHHLVPEPDLWILVDVSVEESIQRRPERLDYYEKNRPQLEEIRKLYIDLFAENADNRWFVVDGKGNVDDVHSYIVKVVKDYLAEN